MGAAVLVAGCSTAPRDTITQVSTIDALVAGAFDGQMPCKDLLSHGDFGIGTFHALDGEMVIVDGKIYQVKADGLAYPVPPGLTTPFATVVRFAPELTVSITKPTDFKELQQLVDRRVASPNVLLAIRIHGQFRDVTARSVPAQSKPYPALVEAAKRQSVFHMDQTSGVLVGFRLPEFVKGVNAPGYHLHLITDDRRTGGHVLNITIERGEAEVDICNRFVMILPKDPKALSRFDLGRDRSGELKKVE
jgi:acetolactate decarboxylase